MLRLHHCIMVYVILYLILTTLPKMEREILLRSMNRLCLYADVQNFFEYLEHA